MSADLQLLAAEIGCESLTPLPRDASTREFYRGTRSGENFILMRYPEPDEKNRTELKQFLRIAAWLTETGIRAPLIFESHQEQGYALLEDLGNTSYGKALREGHNRTELYIWATDVLRRLRQSKPPAFLSPFSQSRIRQNIRQIADYYVPFLHRQRMPDTAISAYLEIWSGIEQSLPTCPQGFLHADFHLENLMLQEGGEGIERCALIDFQDALLGPIPYDLVNLLEDARSDVPQDLQKTLIERYCEGMSAKDRQAFDLWYRVLGTQFHCRVIGLFIKFAAEQNRDEYLIHISRLQNYLKTHLEHPVLEPLKDWFKKEGVSLDPVKDLNGNAIRDIFRSLTS
ncbi:MAG: phosphotransferase [Alphaproteobacteria bacterium]|nr:phosphotransferase [Alphaproteobacteria bacterium]QQS56120.1 MAG: phosphotransferase [Alphaproteobacteria bacterium]